MRKDGVYGIYFARLKVAVRIPVERKQATATKDLSESLGNPQSP